MVEQGGQRHAVDSRDSEEAQSGGPQIHVAERGDQHANGIEQNGGRDEVETGKSQGLLAEREGDERQAVVAGVAESRGQDDGHQDRAFKMQETSEQKRQQPGQCRQGGGETHGGENLA